MTSLSGSPSRDAQVSNQRDDRQRCPPGLDCLRAGDVERGEQLLETMEEVFDMLVPVEYPDAITGGLRRAADALRAVVERSRADVTTTVLQTNLQRAIESRGS